MGSPKTFPANGGDRWSCRNEWSAGWIPHPTVKPPGEHGKSQTIDEKVRDLLPRPEAADATAKSMAVK